MNYLKELILVFAIVFAGCSKENDAATGNPTAGPVATPPINISADIIGKWKDSKGIMNTEFFEDNTCIITNTNDAKSRQMSGNWILLKDGRIKMTFPGINSNPPMIVVFTPSFKDKNTIDMVSEDGMNEKLSRVR